MSAPMSKVVSDLDSSSSSSEDEETKQRLQSAVWNVEQQHTRFPSGSANPNKNEKLSRTSTKLKSLRAIHTDLDLSDDIHGGIQATPEQKTFVAKKLTAFLDRNIAEYSSKNKQTKEDQSEDDFKLFSTSRKFDSNDILPSIGAKVHRKKKIVESSSESDSDEMKQMLASVAVSFEDVKKSQRIISAVEDKPAQQVISDLSPMTSNLSSAMPSAGANLEGAEVNGNCTDTTSNSRKKKKKKKQKEKLKNNVQFDLSEISAKKAGSKNEPNNNEHVDSNHGDRHGKRKSKHSHKDKLTVSSTDHDLAQDNQRLPNGEGAGDIMFHNDSSTSPCKKRKKKHKAAANQSIPLESHDQSHDPTNMSTIEQDTLVCANGNHGNSVSEGHVKKSKKRKKHKHDVSK